MNVLWWEKWLNEQYPDLKRIVRSGVRELAVNELVAELGDGVAVAVIDRSRPHFHLRAQETYELIEGRLGLVVAGKVVVLDAPLRSAVVEPGVVHNAITLNRGPAVVEVVSSPPWTASDHFEV